MEYKWSQPYPGESRYERLFRAQRILQLSRHVMLLDTVELSRMCHRRLNIS